MDSGIFMEQSLFTMYNTDNLVWGMYVPRQIRWYMQDKLNMLIHVYKHAYARV